MNKISNDMKNETIEAKVRWFRSLSPAERMDIICNFKGLDLECKPPPAWKKRFSTG